MFGETGHRVLELRLVVLCRASCAARAGADTSPIRSTFRSSRGWYVLLNSIAIAPIRAAAIHPSIQSTPDGNAMPIRVPLPTPAASMRFATRASDPLGFPEAAAPVHADDEVVVAVAFHGAPQQLRHRRWVLEQGCAHCS